MSKGLKLSEILVTVLISVVFAIIYNLWWFVYNIVQVAGIHLEQLTYGVWFMAAVVCYLIIPKPGIALLAEIAAGAGETIVMGKFDIPTIIYAINEVAGSNLLLFIVFRSISGIVLAGLVSYWIVKALDKTGVTKFFRPASQQDYDNL